MKNKTLREQVFDYVLQHPGTSTEDLCKAMGLTPNASIFQLGSLYRAGRLSRRECKRPSNRGIKTYYRFSAIVNGKTTGDIEYQYPVFPKMPHKISTLFI